MNNSISLSILIRTHNAIGRIGRCIDSVFALQSSKPDIMYICDDCSTDGTWEYLLSKYALNKGVVLLRNETNHGPGYTMRRLIMACATDYYMLIDDDDYWIKTDVIDHVKNDLIINHLPDKIYYRANDILDWRLHFIFAYKTTCMQRLTYFSLWSHDDDYTLQTLGPDFNEIILDNYIFICPYVGHGVSRIRPSIIYKYLHMICKKIYSGKIEAAKQMYTQFHPSKECSTQELVIYKELTEFFNKIG